MLSIKFTISVAVHGQLDLVKKCMASVLKHSKDYELIIVDNASDSRTKRYLMNLDEKHSHIKLVQWKQNKGFCDAQNHALTLASGLYFVVLNSDIEVCADWLVRMRECFLDDPLLGACGVMGNCCSIGDDGIGHIGSQVDYVEASCMMTPVHLAKRLGLFREAFRFAYCEDVDYSLRLREKGYRIVLIPLDIQHERAATAKAVVGEIDMAGFHMRNHIVLARDWREYIKERTFDKRISIKRRGARGDVLLVTPVLRAIKQQWAHAEITIQTDFPEVFKGNPDVRYMSAGPPSGHFDEHYDLDLAYERTPENHIVKSYAKVCGIDGITDMRPRVFPSAKDRAKTRHLMLRSEQWVVIHPGPTAWPGRNWSAEKFQTTAKEVRSQGWKVALIGTADAYSLTNDLDLRGKTTFHELAAVVERSNLFIGVDSLPMHLAQAFQVPIVGLFGCIDPKYRLANWNFCRGVVAKNVGCLGCHHILPAPRTDSRCLRSSVLCMENITVPQVLGAISEVLVAKTHMMEASKIREKVKKYCVGRGVDLGCGQDKIMLDAYGVDREDFLGVNKLADIGGPLPFADEAYDYVFSSHALEDCWDTEGVLTEWVRILKKGGHVIIQVPHPMYYRGSNLEHLHPGFEPDELEQVLSGLGCKMITSFLDRGPDRYSSVIVCSK